MNSAIKLTMTGKSFNSIGIIRLELILQYCHELISVFHDLYVGSLVIYILQIKLVPAP